MKIVLSSVLCFIMIVTTIFSTSFSASAASGWKGYSGKNTTLLQQKQIIGNLAAKALQFHKARKSITPTKAYKNKETQCIGVYCNMYTDILVGKYYSQNC